MVWSQEEIEAFKARRRQGEGDVGKVNDWVCADQQPVSRKSFGTTRKWQPTPTEENRRCDDWLGGGGGKPRRSWKVKGSSS